MLERGNPEHKKRELLRWVRRVGGYKEPQVGVGGYKDYLKKKKRILGQVGLNLEYIEQGAKAGFEM